MSRAGGIDARKTSDDPLVGDGHGIDHLMIVVESLPTAARDFQDKLGFAIVHGEKHASGTENKSILLEEEEYLELLALYNREGGSPDIAEIDRFLSKGEGAIGFGVQISSAERAASYLRAKGIGVVESSGSAVALPGDDEPPPVLHKTVLVRTGQPLVDEVFFLHETDKKAWDELRLRHPELPDYSVKPEHPNTAIGALHPWLAVADLPAAAQAYESVGFPKVREAHFRGLDSDAVEVRIGKGSLLLVGGGSPGGPVEKYLSQRDASYGLIGISLQVGSLERALERIQNDLASQLKRYEGLFGSSILIPATAAHGVWMELFESRTAKRESD